MYQRARVVRGVSIVHRTRVSPILIAEGRRLKTPNASSLLSNGGKKS